MELPLFAELKRRRIFRALVGYGIAAFAVLQIIEPIMHGLRWPDAVLSYVVAALAVGFPVVVGLAWIFDVNAGRMIRTQGDPVGALRGARLLLVLVGIGVLAAAPGVVWYFVVRGIARTALRDKSIAVLPFASLNAGEDTAFFADGIHGDLLTQLSKIGDLKVISRTSVLQYRTGTRNLREIGEALGVATVLEGSVQRADNRVRIEARLSDTHDDRQIWADRYDRELTDVFAIQSAVTEEIARALKARLSPEEKGRIERRPTRSTEAYELYLRGREYEERPNQLAGDFRIAEQMYRRAIEKDPGFALAHARLSYLDTSRFYWYQIDASEARLAEAAREAERALTLDPEARPRIPLSHRPRSRSRGASTQCRCPARSTDGCRAPAHFEGRNRRPFRAGRARRRVRRYRRHRCSDPRDRVLAFDARLSLTRAASHRPEMAAAPRRPAFPQVGRALADIAR